MSVTSVSQVTSSSSLADDSASRVPLKTLGQQDFLKLLVAQMSNQDPLNPKADTDFIGQMAQFSSLDTLGKLRTDQQFAQANDLIGQQVELDTLDGEVVVGIVTGAQLVKGVPKVVVNGQLFDLSQVQSISPDGTSVEGQLLAQANGLLGHSVQLRTDTGVSAGGTVTAVQVENGRPRIVVNGQSYDLSSVVSVTSGPDPLADGLSSLRSDQQLLRWDQQFLQANALLGRVVELQVDKDNTLTGVVSGVKVEAGTPKVVVDGRSYDLSRVLSVASAPVDQTL